MDPPKERETCNRGGNWTDNLATRPVGSEGCVLSIFSCRVKWPWRMYSGRVPLETSDHFLYTFIIYLSLRLCNWLWNDSPVNFSYFLRCLKISHQTWTFRRLTLREAGFSAREHLVLCSEETWGCHPGLPILSPWRCRWTTKLVMMPSQRTNRWLRRPRNDSMRIRRWNLMTHTGEAKVHFIQAFFSLQKLKDFSRTDWFASSIRGHRRSDNF